MMDNRLRFKLLCLLTLSASLFGIIAIILVINERYYGAGALLLLSAIIDRYDGKIARKHHITTHYGLWLDTLNDFISFICAPMVLMMSLGLIPSSWLSGILIIIYVYAGIYRLQRFHQETKTTIVTGLPTTIAGLIIVIVSLLLYQFNITHTLYPVFVLSISMLMMATFTLKKL